MKKQRLITALVISAGISLSPVAQSEDLLEIYQLAKRYDPTYQAAIYEYEAAKQKSPQAWAAVLPQVNLSGSHVEIDEDRTIGANPSTSESYEVDDYRLSLTQTIYRQDQFDRISQANAEVASAEARFNNAALDLILRTTIAYMAVLGAEDNLTFASAEREAIQQQLEQTKQRFEVGLTAITDVHEAQARYDQSVASEIEAQNLLAVRKEILREITGQPFGKLAPLADQTPLVTPEPNDINSWVTTALERNLLLLAADKTKEAARYAKDAAKAGHYPTLDLNAEYSNADSTGGILGSREVEDTTVGLVLNIPIYSGGGTSAISREAAARYQQSKDLYELQRRTTERETRNAFLTTLSNISRVKALKQVVTKWVRVPRSTCSTFSVNCFCPNGTMRGPVMTTSWKPFACSRLQEH